MDPATGLNPLDFKIRHLSGLDLEGGQAHQLLVVLQVVQGQRQALLPGPVLDVVPGHFGRHNQARIPEAFRAGLGAGPGSLGQAPVVTEDIDLPGGVEGNLVVGELGLDVLEGEVGQHFAVGTQPVLGEQTGDTAPSPP